MDEVKPSLGVTFPLTSKSWLRKVPVYYVSCKRSLVTTSKFPHVLLVCALGNNGRNKKEPAPAFRPKKLAPADLTGACYDGSLLNTLKTL